MTVNWLRRGVLAATCASLSLLAACGSSTIESALNPARVVSFGDGMSDLGNASPSNGAHYSVNDGTTNVWALQYASDYAVPLASSASGGKSYAQGNARVTLKPDAIGQSAPTVTDQITSFLASNTPGATDLLLVNAGIGDAVALMAQVQAGTLTESQLVDAMTQAGKDLGAQTRRLVTAGATHVVVAGVYNLGLSPWARALGKSDLLTQASSAFNQAFLVSVVDLGASVLYVDTAYYFNLVVGTPASYSLSNGTDAVCTSVDAGVGIGTGTGKVSSLLCNTSTLVSGADYSKYVFADGLYFTPVAARLFGDYAYNRTRTRW